MKNQGIHAKEFIIGAAVGSLLGSVAALLTAPKTGSKLRSDICDTYCDISDKTQDLVSKGRSFASDIGCKTCDWGTKAKSVVDSARKTVKGWVSEEEEEEEEETTKDLLIGGLVGGVLGAAIGLLLAPKAGSELREDIADTYEDLSERAHDFKDQIARKGKSFTKSANSKANKWYAFAQSIVENLSDGAQEKGEDLLDHLKGLVNHKQVNDVLNWAQLGYRAWQGIQSKKRK